MPPTIKLEPQFRHSYLSPSDRPGVNQVILQVKQVVNGRFEFRLSDIEFSDCIIGVNSRDWSAVQNQHNYLGGLSNSTHRPTIAAERVEVSKC